MTRRLSYAAALNEAQRQCMEEDTRVYVVGLGVPGPNGVFGTTAGLVDLFGPERVVDTPSAENGVTGVALGSTVLGMRPIVVHIRVDFALLAIDQMINQVAKWHFMYGGRLRAPMVFRMIMGRGWGQGPQHSQSIQSFYAHTPGFKVVMPVTPYDAKGMMIAAVRDDAPVVVMEHRWLYGIEDEVPDEMYEVPLDKGRVARAGRDVTVVATSQMVVEAVRAADILRPLGVSIEVIDLRSIAPMDMGIVLESVRKTGALIAADTGGKLFGVASEVVAGVCETPGITLKVPPQRIGLPPSPSPTSPSLSVAYYPRAADIVRTAAKMVGIAEENVPQEDLGANQWYDVPDRSFIGPY